MFLALAGMIVCSKKQKTNPAMQPIAFVLFIVVVIGAVASLDVVWDIADTFNGLMAIPNFIALFALSGVVAKLTKEYFFDKNKMAK